MKQTESDQYIFISNFIYNPKTQSLMSTQNLIFHSEFAIKNFTSACGYKFDHSYDNKLTASIYIPQSIMIHTYLDKI